MTSVDMTDRSFQKELAALANKVESCELALQCICATHYLHDLTVLANLPTQQTISTRLMRC